MPVFPQLNSGAAIQYPARREEQHRTVLVEAESGALQRYADPGGQCVRWDLRYEALTDEEAEGLLRFFRECAGRLSTFCFADPTSNLLRSTESLASDPWAGDPFIRISPGPGLGEFASHTVTNVGQVEQALWQEVVAPHALTYTLSAQVRASDECVVRFGFWSLPAEVMVEKNCNEEWRQVVVEGRLDGSSSGIRFGLHLPAGVRVEIAHPQVEPQAGVSHYVPSAASMAIYPETRFDQDDLVVVSKGPGCHSTYIRLISKVRR